MKRYIVPWCIFWMGYFKRLFGLFNCVVYHHTSGYCIDIVIARQRFVFSRPGSRCWDGSRVRGVETSLGKWWLPGGAVFTTRERKNGDRGWIIPAHGGSSQAWSHCSLAGFPCCSHHDSEKFLVVRCLEKRNNYPLTDTTLRLGSLEYPSSCK